MKCSCCVCYKLDVHDKIKSLNNFIKLLLFLFSFQFVMFVVFLHLYCRV